MTTQQLAVHLMTTVCGTIAGLICMAAVVAAVLLVTGDRPGPMGTLAGLAGLLVLTVALNKALLAAALRAHDYFLGAEEEPARPSRTRSFSVTPPEQRL